MLSGMGAVLLLSAYDVCGKFNSLGLDVYRGELCSSLYSRDYKNTTHV